MQFYLNGFKPGDPSLHPNARDLNDQTSDHVDVLIVGCGPTGLTLATQLAQFPDIKTMIIDQKSGPLKLGQADGISCRSLEMFEAFGFSEKVLKEAYWVNETMFWAPSNENADVIARSGRIQDVADDLSEMPHVILSQARIHDFYLEIMLKSPNRLEPKYNRKFCSLDSDANKNYPVTATLDYQGSAEKIHAKYIVGCDGARSGVRKSIGLELVGETANKAWGVMDVLVDTNFPDIRFKSVIRSHNKGNVLIIPREGGYLVRLYIEMEALAEGQRAKDREVTIDKLIDSAQRVLHPYYFSVKEVIWWSIYEIGQRLCSKFDNQTGDQSANVFIAGDACHTHSPKAGLGMNVSIADAFNLGWKLASVLKGNSPENLLSTYSTERKSIAQELIDFDRHWAKEFSNGSKVKDARDPKAFQEYFEEHGKYTAGVSVQYSPSIICKKAVNQSLAKELKIGMRFHSAPVYRLWDAKPMQLGHCLKADGRWRLMIFNDQSKPTDTSSELWKFCDWLKNDITSPINRVNHKGEDIDSIIDIRVVFQQSYKSIAVENTHPLLTPKKGRYSLPDTEKMFCPDPNFNIFDRRGIDRLSGCTIVLRPDQYIADIQSLNDKEGIVDFFCTIFQ